METATSISMSRTDALDLANQVVDWLKDQFDASGAERFVLGISGGIDSAVVAGLCARAVGPERVLGVLMPSASNPDDLASAQKVVDTFGVKSTTVDLTAVADLMYSTLPDSAALWSDVLNEAEPSGQDRRIQLARANVRPRLRMITNYWVSNLTGGLVVGTGNKSELMIGYYTKYGDGGVDLFPITDLYKFEVRAVAAAIGVPESVITRPPSAGLWQGQTDEQEIGITYEDLDTALQAIESGDTSGIDSTVLERIRSMHEATGHKRKPLPMFTRS